MTTFRTLYAVGLIISACAHGADAPRGYTNDTWIMKEGTLAVNDLEGKPAYLHTNWSYRVGPAMLRIVWTETTDFGWNFTTNPAPRKEGLPGISIPKFLNAEFGAKSLVWTVIPDTPFRLATINGRFAPVLWDTKQKVLWRLEGLEQAMGNSDTIVAHDRKVKLIQSGGDWFGFLTLDFSDGAKGIRVQYWERFDGY